MVTVAAVLAAVDALCSGLQTESDPEEAGAVRRLGRAARQLGAAPGR